MPGTRPIAAARLAQPALEEASGEYATNPAPEPDSHPEPVSLAQVRELIVVTGTDKLSTVDPSKYGWLLERAKELADRSR